MKRIKLVSFYITLMVMLFTVFSLVSIRANTGGDIDGTIDAAGSNNDVEVNAFELQSTSGSALVTNSAVIDPYQHYRMHLDIQDIDGMNDLRSITFKFFNLDRPESQIRDSFDGYTTTGIREIDSDNYPNFMLSDDAFIVEWSNETDTFVMTGGDGTTWQLSEGAIQENPNNNFVFNIDFRVAKVALNNNAWYIGALVLDGANNDLSDETFVSNGNYGVNWFGELQVSDQAIVRWDDVDAGTDFYGTGTTTSMINVSTSSLESVTFLANGYYQQRMGSSATWAAIGDIPLSDLYGNEAKLTTEASQSAFNPQEFGIGVALDYDVTSVNTRLDSSMQTIRGHQLDTSTYNAQIWRARTQEAGTAFSNIIFRVALSDIFQNATYVGRLTIGISNETDILDAAAALSQASSGPVTSGSAVGVYAETESELTDLLANTNIQVPIYLKNGFIELTTAPSITIANSASKPVIGNVFITGDDIELTNLTMLYGDLHIEGDNVLLTNTKITSHSPGGDLYVKASNFTGANIRVEGSVYVSNQASGTISQNTNESSPLSEYRIAGHVFVSEQSSFTVDNLYLLIEGSVQGNINVTGNSIITLKNFTNFEDLIITNSTGFLLGDSFTGAGGFSSPDRRPIGSSMKLTNSTVTQTAASFTFVDLYESSTLTKDSGWAGITRLFDQSQLNFNGGEITELNNKEQSHVEMTGGYVYDDFINSGSTADISGGEIGFDNLLASNDSSPTNTHGLFLDDTNTTMITPSTVTISGTTSILHLTARQNARIAMNHLNSVVEKVTTLDDNAAFTLTNGTVKYLRMVQDATFTMEEANASLYKAHIFNDAILTVQAGTVGNGDSSASLVSINDTARFEMTGGTLDLGSVSDAKVDDDFVDTSGDSRSDTTVSTTNSNGKRGLSIRDDATVTLSGLTITSTTELELRDNGSLTMNTTAVFDRMVKDHISVFNENDGEGSNLSSDGPRSLMEIYVQPETESTTRPTRSLAEGESNINFDYNHIEGAGSALEEARRLYDAFGHKVNVYLVDGTYNEASLIEMDRDFLGLLYTPNGRTDLKTTIWTLTETPSGAIVDQGVLVTGDVAVIQGVYFNLDTENIFVSRSGISAQEADILYNYVVQSAGVHPLIEVQNGSIEVTGNYLTRPSASSNDSVALSVEVQDNRTININNNSIDNIQNDAVVVSHTGTEDLVNLFFTLNRIGSNNRPIDGNGILISAGSIDTISFNNNDIQNVSKSGVVFKDVTLDGSVGFLQDDIFNIPSGHAIHFTDGVTFGPNYTEIDFFDVGLSPNSLTGYAIFFDQMAHVKNIELVDTHSSANYIENAASAIRIEGATTISGITIDSMRVRNIYEDAYYLGGIAVESILFTHDDTKTDGHRLDAQRTADDTKRGSIVNVSHNAIYITGSSLDGFAMNGFTIDQFATAGNTFAGIDFDVQNLSNLLINQAIFLFETIVQGPSTYGFDEYRAIQTEFTNGNGPALRFHLDDANSYSNNQLFNPVIESNAVGIAFAGSLSSSDPVQTIFGSNANFSVNPNLSSLKAFVTASGITLSSPSALVVNETQSGLTNNTVEIQDNTQRLDLDAFRTAFADLNAAARGARLFIVESADSQSLVASPQLDLNALSIGRAIDSVFLYTDSAIYNLRVQYFVDDDNQSILGAALDDLKASNGTVGLELNAPNQATEALIFTEAKDGTLTSQSALVSGTTILFDVPVASLSGSASYVLLDSDAEFLISIQWLNGSGQVISQAGVFIDTSQVTTPLINQLNVSSGISQTNFKNLLDDGLKSQISSFISETAFYTNLMSNLDVLSPLNSYAEFLTLFADVNAYELAQYNALDAVNTTLVSTGSINPTIITDVLNAISGSSLVRTRNFSSTPVVTATTIERLQTINTSLSGIALESRVIDQLLANKPYADYFTMLSALETIIDGFNGAELNGLNYDTLQSALDDASSGEDVTLLKSVSETITLNQTVNIDFSGYTLTGDFTLTTNETTTITFSGTGTLTGDLTVNAPTLTFNSDLNVQGATNITAIGDSSFNTSGVHTGGIAMNGPGRINALNETTRPVITINTTENVQIDGFVSEVAIAIDNAVVSINASLNRLTHNNRPSDLTLGSSAASSLNGLVKNETTGLYFNTLAEALAVVQSGETLQLEPGTYTAPMHLTVSSITIKGANAGIDARGSRTQESIISGTSITLSATDLTLDGLKVLNTFIERFNQSANGLSIKNSIIEHEYVLDEYFAMITNNGDRYILKGYSNVSNVSLENLHIIGPGKDALATESAIVDLVTPSQFFIGGIDLNQVHDSTLSGVLIEDVSRYSLNISNTSSGILVEDYSVLNTGHSTNDFMAAMALFKPSSSSEYPKNITVSGTFDFENVPVGFDIRSISEAHLSPQNFTLTVSGVGIDIYGIHTSPPAISDDALAQSLGATVRWQANGEFTPIDNGGEIDQSISALLDGSGFSNLALYYITDPDPLDDATSRPFDFNGLDVEVFFNETDLPE